MSRKSKRAVWLIIMVYVLINSLVWGMMKAYINSYNAVNNEKLVMAQITDSEKGVEISVMGNSFCIPDEKKDADKNESALMTVVPLKIRVVSEIFRQTGQKIVRELHGKSMSDNC